MPTDNKKRKKVRFEYKILPTYTTYSVSGAYGGFNAFGEISINFFYERPSIPKTEEFNLLDDGTLDTNNKKEERKEEIIRNVLFAVSMNPDIAKSLADWLYKQVNDYKEKFSSPHIKKEKA